jgi:transmembrane sensor
MVRMRSRRIVLEAKGARTVIESTVIDQAIEWHLGQARMTPAEWDSFVLWLEADAAHAAAYDRIAALDAGLPPLLATAPAAVAAPVAANDNPPQRWWRWGAGAVAAALVLALSTTLFPGADPYSVTTRPGETRRLALADGTRIELGGGSALRLDHRDARVAALDAGEAVFHVRHDAAHPFELRSGSAVVRDLGTVFDVARAGPRLDVAVAEGSVMFRPDAEAITLRSGETITLREDAGTITRSLVAPDDVGGWRRGALGFQDASVGEVAATIGRVTGARVAVAPGLSARPFTGMVRLTGEASRDVPHVAGLIGATWRKQGDQWIWGVGAPTAR